MSALTQAERDTLNAAEQILIKIVANGGVIMTSLHKGWDTTSVTYFTPGNTQHTSIYNRADQSLAGKIDKCLALRAEEEGRAEQIKAERIARLKTELAALTGTPQPEEVA